MKKVIVMVMVMTALCGTAQPQLSVNTSYHLESDGLRYRYSRGGLELTYLVNSAESDRHADVVVPDSVYSPDFEQNLAVLTIGEEAFANCNWLNSVKLPATVDKIKEGVFYKSSALTSVDMSECVNVTEIPRGTFAYATALERVALPDGIRKIGVSAFRGSAITDFTVPDAVDSIGNFAFFTPSLKHFKMGKSLKTLGYYALGSECETVEWNDSLTYIGSYNFLGSDADEIILPKSIRSIDAGAFAEMRSLKRLVCRVENPADIDVDKMAFAIVTNPDDWLSIDRIPILPPYDIEHTPVPEGCVLYVPAQSVELYRQADVWKEFAEIRAIDDDDETSLEQLTPAAGADGATYDLLGRRVSSPRPGQLVVSGGKLYRR